MYTHSELMNIQAEVLYVHDQTGRIITINEYNNRPAPRFFWGQTNNGHVIRFRSDVPNNVVHGILQIMGRDDPTKQLTNVINVLEKDKGISGFWIGPAYAFNEIVMDYTDATLVTEENKFCLEHGFSSLFSELMFREPCYMVTENNIAVSVCFSARNSDKAAEAGVETLEDYRGKGFAIRVASSWAQAIRQSQRIPLYSTSWDNYSSQSVAKRLQLHFYGTDISIY
ncbi:GNAT family N-acetyltransferase [Paenibacillus tarimensis]